MIKQADVTRALEMKEARVETLKADWNHIMSLSVWGDLHFDKIGAQPRFRKRVLECGENFRSVIADRSWIPQPREQLKSALGSSVKLRDSLASLEQVAVSMSDGQDFQTMQVKLLAWRQAVILFLEEHEHRWAELLDSLHGDEEE